ncbi:hypothetical protein CJO96_12720 [Ralstonia solanacearum]|nr:hypothetical protein CJO84_12915 [Ralstonia solanacearum]AXW39151.1 hypothetical protein CJO89_13285 [Ralstonia solanacearum]AXW71929.1 hypothetical protein CJO96_12720 [Ralstonia solanacearum]
MIDLDWDTSIPTELCFEGSEVRHEILIYWIMALYWGMLFLNKLFQGDLISLKQERIKIPPFHTFCPERFTAMFGNLLHHRMKSLVLAADRQLQHVDMEPVIERITALFYQCWSLYARDCFNDFATIREQSGKNVYTNLEFSPSILPDACQREFRSKVIILLAFFNIMLYEIGTSTHHFRMTG